MKIPNKQTNIPNKLNILVNIYKANKNKQKDDKAIIDTSLKILKSSGSKKSVVKIGNVELFNLLIDKLLDNHKYLITIEEGSIGGFGHQI